MLMAASDPFGIRATGGRISVGMESNGSDLPEVSIEASLDGGSTWFPFPTDGTATDVASGGTILFRSGSSGNERISSGEDDYRNFVIEGAMCEAFGNIMSLLSRDFASKTEIGGEYCFYGLFSDCDTLTSAPVLYATKMSPYCYGNMFQGCSAMSSAPSLSGVTELAEGCFSYMFTECDGITSLPPMPSSSVELKESCYSWMFSDCFGLRTISSGDLPVPQVMAEGCYDGMFYGCEILDIDGFSLAGVTTLATNCFSFMFSGCVGLSSIPQMPSAPMVDDCYDGMFEGCSSITDISGFVPSGQMADGCCRDMFYGCGGITAACSFSNVQTLAEECFQNMFSECGRLASAPPLPGSGLARACYAYMFSSCASLSYFGGMSISGEVAESCCLGMFSGCSRLGDSVLSGISISGATALADSCFSKMFEGTSISHVPQFPSVASLEPSCYYGMFSGCQNLEDLSGFVLPSEMAEGCCREMFLDCGKIDDHGISSIEMSSVSTMAKECFAGMFRGCEGITTMPVLPNAEMAESCYSYMFAECTLLSYAGSVPAVSLATRCFEHMFEGCTALQDPPSLPGASVAMAPYCYSYMFSKCSGLLSAPELPSMSMADHCYDRMFFYCTGLSEMPDLPATVLAEACYRSMFCGCLGISEMGDVSALGDSEAEIGKASFYGMMYGCTGLGSGGNNISPSELAQYSCSYMFFGCDSIKKTPLILSSSLGESSCDHMFASCLGLESFMLSGAFSMPNGILGKNCCSYMFEGCRSLRGAFEAGHENEFYYSNIMPSTMSERCFSYMFSRCSSMEMAPALMASSLAESCYEGMFSGCSSMRECPELPAMEMAPSCYYKMFMGCSGLVSVPNNVTSKGRGVLAEGCCMEMFLDCTALSSIPGMPQASLSASCYSGMFSGCRGIRSFSNWAIDYENGKPPYEGMHYDIVYVSHYYSNSGPRPGAWFLVQIPDEYDSPLSEYDISEYYTSDVSRAERGSGTIEFDGGRIVAELKRSESGMLPALSLENGCYESMFKGCSNLMYAPELPSESLSDSCYRSMFSRCSTLLEVPDLPATTLAPYCYASMFESCYRIKSHKDLPATTLAPYCYYSMFLGCSSLKEATATGALASENGVLAPYCCHGMFSGCIGLVKAPNLKPMSLADHCYSSMFNGCTGISESPALPATILAPSCYDSMFRGCVMMRRAKNIEGIRSGSVAEYCCQYMFDGCVKLAGIPEFGALNMARRCYCGMFRGCKSIVSVPELPSFSLADGCYEAMFARCESLTGIPMVELPQAPKRWEFDATNPSGRILGVRYWTSDSGAGEGWYLYSVPSQWGESVFYRTDFKGILEANIGKWDSFPDGFEGVSGTESDEHILFSGVPMSWWGGSGHTDVYASYSYPPIQYRPRMPAAVMADACYSRMFEYCSSLRTIDGIAFDSVTSLAESCYEGMFYGCAVSLVDGSSGYSSSSSSGTPFPNEAEWTVPLVLSGASAKKRCFDHMFANCTDLVIAPEIAALDTAESCFEGMFSGCTSLMNAPSLPNSDFAMSCCRQMFYHCSSLVDAPSVSAISMSEACCEEMFAECSSLVSAPEVSAETLGERCMYRMFAECESLVDLSGVDLGGVISMDFSCCEEMFAGCTSFVGSYVPVDEYVQEGGSYGFDSFSDPYVPQYSDSASSGSDSELVNPTLPEDGIPLAYRCYAGMFRGCSNLMYAPVLPSMRLSHECYAEMFYGCTSLADDGMNGIPFSEAMLADFCYMYMFAECDSLTRCPILGQDDLKEGCYFGMFSGCDGIDSISGAINPSASIAGSCYGYMFYGCTMIGAVREYEIPARDLLPFADIAQGCYCGMFSGCTSLKYAPDLPATVMREQCYSYMFAGCTRLSYPNDDFTGRLTGRLVAGFGRYAVLAEGCFEGMYYGCKSIYAAPVLYPETLATGCYSYMFAESGVNSAPGLRARILAPMCYEYMFSKAQITHAPAILSGDGTVEMAESCCSHMFDGCGFLLDASGMGLARVSVLSRRCCEYMFAGSSISATPRFPDISVDLAERCYEGMFSDCKLLETVRSTWMKSSAKFCCYSMFKGCTGLITAGLDMSRVETLYESCYESMFNGCSILRIPPVLPGGRDVGGWGSSSSSSHSSSEDSSSSFVPATGLTLPKRCYANMFYGCGKYESWVSPPDYGLLKTPVVRAVRLGESSCEGMFKGCVVLKDAGLVDFGEVKKLDERCCASMFYGCTRLADSNSYSESQSMLPTLPGPRVRLAKECFMQMFGDSGIRSAPALPATILAEGCYKGMFASCKSLWFDQYMDYYDESYWIDGSDSFSSSSSSPGYGSGQSPSSGSVSGYGSSSGADEDLPPPYELPAKVLSKSCYAGMFESCTSLQYGPKISADSLAESCCASMFRGCSWIIYAPNLEAARLEKSCYEYMFRDCTKLRASPAIFATVLADSCCKGMFMGCDSLTSIWKTYAKDLADGCFSHMFSGCSSLIRAPGLSYDVLKKDCFSHMFNGCISMRDVPVVKFKVAEESCCESMFEGCSSLLHLDLLDFSGVKTLSKSCFKNMFKGCSKIAYPLGLPSPDVPMAESCYEGMFMDCTRIGAGIGGSVSMRTVDLKSVMNLEKACFKNMFRGCSTLDLTWMYGNVQEFFDLPGADVPLAESCYEGMFSGTNTTYAPELRAESLANYCYKDMFSGCVMLQTAPALASEHLADYCYSGMFENCIRLDLMSGMQIVTLPAETLKTGCYQKMFRGCISLPSIHICATDSADYAMLEMCFCDYEYANGISHNPSSLASAKIAFLSDPAEKYTDPYKDWIPIPDSGNTNILYIPDTASFSVWNMAPTGWTISHYS